MSEPKPIHIVLILAGLLLVMLFVVAQVRGTRSKRAPTGDDLERLGERWGSSFTRPALAHYDTTSAQCVRPRGAQPLSEVAEAQLSPSATCVLRFEDSGLLPKSLRLASGETVQVVAKLQADEPITLELELGPERRETTLSLGKKTAELRLTCPSSAVNKPCLVTLGEPGDT